MLNFHAKAGFTLSKDERTKFEKHILQGVLRTTYKTIKRAEEEIQLNIQAKIEEYIENSPEIQSMIYGNLRYDLGILEEEALSVSTQIPKIVGRSVKIYVAYNQYSVSLNVKIITDDYSDILNIKDGTFIQTYTRKPPYEIHWLEWLLTKGNEMIVGEYSIKYAHTEASRSGGAVMIKTGYGWRIPPQYSGTPTNNFITRSLENIEDYIFEVSEKYWR